MFGKNKSHMPGPDEALPGRATEMPVLAKHFVSGHPLKAAFPEGLEMAMFGMGCFWGAERKFWQANGVYTTAVGYAGGHTPNPTYQEVCSGLTGHNEVVLVVFDPKQITYDQILKIFWESHDPTQGMRQGNDFGTQYRSGLYYFGEAQRKAAEASRDMFQEALNAKHYGDITTEACIVRPVNLAHPTGADRGDDFVRSKASARSQLHDARRGARLEG